MAVEKPAVGSHAIGAESVAGDFSFSVPVVSITAPTSLVTTGGPDLTVTWTYTQAESRPQERYRVIIDDGAATVYYDSGLVISGATSHVVDVVAEGVPTDTTGTSLRVTVQAIAQGTSQYGDDNLAFDIQWGVVTATITAPTDLAVLAIVSTTVSWTFGSTRSKTQSAYQVRLLGAASGIEVFTSGKILDTGASSYAVPYTLSDSSSYDVELTLYNSEGVPSTPDVHRISVILDNTYAYPDVESVGTVYEVGVAGEGYMLYDNRDGASGQFRYGRQTAGLQAQRFATGETPFEQAIDRYSFGSMSDYRGGRGQFYGDRTASIDNAYLESEGLDPWTPGKLTLLHDMDQEFANTYANLRAVDVDGTLFVQTGNTELTYRSTQGGASSVIDLSGLGIAAGGILDLVTDGQEWYICDGVSAWRGTTSAPGGTWSTVNIERMGWGAGRIVAAYAQGTSTTPNRFTTLNDSGAEENAGGLLTLPDEWTINSFASGSGYVYFSAHGGSRSEIWAWEPGTTNVNLAYEYPLGERVEQMLWHEGQIVAITSHDDNDLSLWRLNPSNTGTLTPFLVDDKFATTITPAIGLAAEGSRVYFSWPAMQTNSGVGTLDLASGGYAKSYVTDVTGEVASIVVWQGKVTLAVRGNGVWSEQDDYVTTGFLRTSNFDGASALPKVFDELTIRGEPLGASESWNVAYSIDGGNSYVNLTEATLDTAGQQAKTTSLDKRANSMSVQVTLNGPGTTTPTLTLVSTKYHMLGLADTILTLPIDCSDHIRGLNESELNDSGPGRGALRMRRLEGLVQTLVTVQDIDWADTRDTEVYELVAVEAVKWSVYNRAIGKQQVRQVAVCTLRKRIR